MEESVAVGTRACSGEIGTPCVIIGANTGAGAVAGETGDKPCVIVERG